MIIPDSVDLILSKKKIPASEILENYIFSSFKGETG